MTDLIEISYLNEACFLTLNEDDKKYRICLDMAQEDLSDELGEEFYDEIETQYDQDSLTPNNDTLYEDYIKKFLAWQTYFHYLKFANINSTPTGIREFNDENSSVATDIKMYSLEKNVKARADKHKFRMVNYIKTKQDNDSTAFPLFGSCTKEYMSFSITSVDKKNDSIIRVNKTIITNE